MKSLSEIWPRRNGDSREPRTAFVLSGGAAMGALQVGMLRALIERRIRPDLILGCSVGALNGVVLAGDPTLATVGRMQDVWMDLLDRNIVPTGLFPSTVQLFRKGESITSNDAMRALLDDVLPAAAFDELAVRFECVATDIDAIAEHWFHTGDLAPAVLASCAMPAVFPAVEIGGARYVDGAVVNDVPVQRAVDLGATRIFILQVGGVDRPRPDPRRPIDMALLAYWIARRHRLLEDLARIPDDVEVVILPHGNPTHVRYNDLSRSAQLMDIAYRSSIDHIDARIDGRIPPTYGPVRDTDLGDALRDADDLDAELEAAHRLYAAATEAGTPGSDDVSEMRARLTERAEAIGPAMRALVERVREHGVMPFTRHGDDDPPAEEAEPVDS